ncbi:MAG: hypothetical protein WCI12_08725 [Actinomycetes bacterium]
MEITGAIIEFLEEVGLERRVLNRQVLFRGPIDNHDVGFAVRSEDFSSSPTWGSKKGRNFSSSPNYSGARTQLILGAEPLSVLTFDRKDWTLEIAPYGCIFDGLVPRPRRLEDGRTTLQIWERRKGAPFKSELSDHTTAAIALAAKERRSNFIACRGCHTRFPPEELWYFVFCSTCVVGEEEPSTIVYSAPDSDEDVA